MKMKRRLWVLLLSAALIVTLFPAAAFADDPVPENGEAVETSIPEPVWVVYDGPELRGVVGTDILTNLGTTGISRFVVTFSDGSKKTFEYTEKEYGDESDPYTAGAFLDIDDPVQDPLEATTWVDAEVRQNEDKPFAFEKEWNNNVELQVVVHYSVAGEGADAEYETKTLFTNVDVLCAPDFYPLSVKFVPAEGFTVGCLADGDYLTEDAFYGEGNKFTVSYEGWTEGDPDKGLEEGFEKFTTDYVYAKGTDVSGEEVEGFFVSGNVNKMQFVLDDGAAVDIGFEEEKDVEFTYTEYVDTYDEYVSVPFKVSVKATKYMPSVNYPIFTYTGSTIKPKFKVQDANGKTILATSYYVEHANASKMGWYEATITFNDNFADKDKYVDSISTTYGIGPNAPTLYTPVAGKKRLTVKWKKPTSAQLKNITGFCIEMSTDKLFMGNYKRVWVSKTAVKKGKKVVKGLKKGKKYYVRLFAYKTIKQDGEKYKMESNYSKVKYKKTK